MLPGVGEHRIAVDALGGKIDGHRGGEVEVAGLLEAEVADGLHDGTAKSKNINSEGKSIIAIYCD